MLTTKKCEGVSQEMSAEGSALEKEFVHLHEMQKKYL